MNTNDSYIREYLGIIDALDGDLPGRRAAQSYMENSTAIVHGKHVPSSYVPRFFGQETYGIFKDVAETTHAIVAKIITRYREDPAYRTLFDLDERVAELVLLPCGYPDVLPLARIDVFLDEDTGACGFCELNTDGSSGLNEDREQNRALAGSPALREFARRHTLATSELFESWVDEFLAIYGRAEQRVDDPRIAIVDFLGTGAITAEFQEYCRRFSRRGYTCFVADVRDLRFDGAVLRTTDGKRIDAIFRRCVTPDILAHWEESQALIEAVRAQKVVLIGSFAGHLGYDKQIFDVMHHPLTLEFLTEHERELVEACVPQTKRLDASCIDLDEVRAEKDRWIIKPPDGYGARDVHAGNMYAQEEWEALVCRLANGAAGAPFLVQRYIQPYKTPFLMPDGELLSRSDGEIARTTVSMNNMSGLFIFNGRFAGVFSRMGEKPVISEGAGSRHSAGTIWVDCELDGTMQSWGEERR
ncbi:MAG: hypothetical protein ACOYIP_00970 [Coriobacteriales bacterium]